METWHWYQWTMAILMFLGVAATAALHGDERKGKYSFPTKLVSTFLLSFLLYKGGFWN